MKTFIVCLLNNFIIFLFTELPNYPRTEIGYPYDVTVTRRENEGFGFVIISSVNKAGSTIGVYLYTI